MRTHRTLARAAVAAALLGAPAAALAARANPSATSHAVAATAASPKTGSWKISSSGTKSDDLSGSFTVGSGHTIAALHGTIQSGAASACGRGTVSVSGTLKLFAATSSEWAVGHSKSSGIVGPASAKVLHNGKSTTGSIVMVFPATGVSGGNIYYDNGRCDLSFVVKHS